MIDSCVSISPQLSCSHIPVNSSESVSFTLLFFLELSKELCFTSGAIQLKDMG